MQPTEPVLVLPEALRPILDELRRQEPLFHLADNGADRRYFDGLMDLDFWEVGASGGRYSREFVLSVLESRQRQPNDEAWQTKDFHLTEIAPDNYLLTYSLVQPKRQTRRATIWRRTAAGWKVVYHQGTVVDAAGAGMAVAKPLPA